jgi:uncharacterized protein
MAENRPPLPPLEHARSAARRARHTRDSRWRNRAEFLHGRAAIEAFLTRK